MKKIYVIRHCEAKGQQPESELTKKGVKQSLELSSFLSGIKVERIVSSPYRRAIQSIQPLATKRHMDIELNRQLSERTLSTKNMPDWFEKIKDTFEDHELKYEGGESSKEAKNRIVNVIEDAFTYEIENTIIVTHGNLMSLLLNHYNKDFGFDEWNNLSNPDVFLLKLENNRVSYERLWVEKQDEVKR